MRPCEQEGVLLLDVALLLIILLFCHPGTQISCFAPTNFSWKQAAYVDSFCWAAVQQQPQSAPLWLHKVDTSPTFVHTEAFSTSGNIIIILNIISYIITIACAESPPPPLCGSVSPVSSFHTFCSLWPSSSTSQPFSGVLPQRHISPLTSTSSWRSWIDFTPGQSKWPRT